MWVNHHSMFRQIVRTDRPLLFLNLLLLLWTALLPFPTALIAEYLDRGGRNANVAAAVYSANLFLAAIAFTLVWTARGAQRQAAGRADGSARGASRFGAVRRSAPSSTH